MQSTENENEGDGVRVLMLPVSGPPIIFTSADTLHDACELLGGGFDERTDALTDGFLYCRSSFLDEGLPVNPLATALASTLPPGHFIGGPAVLTGPDPDGGPFEDGPLTDDDVERVTQWWALLHRMAWLTREPTAQASEAADLHMTLFQRPLLDGLMDAVPLESRDVETVVGSMPDDSDMPSPGGDLRWVDASEVARQAGIPGRVVFTESVWNEYAVPSPRDEELGQSVAGRVGDIVGQALLHNAGPGVIQGAKAFEVTIRQQGVRRTVLLNTHVVTIEGEEVVAIYRPEDVR